MLSGSGEVKKEESTRLLDDRFGSRYEIQSSCGYPGSADRSRNDWEERRERAARARALEEATVGGEAGYEQRKERAVLTDTLTWSYEEDGWNWSKKLKG